MGRYSFFIVSSFINGYSVSATGELDYDLLWRDKQYIAVADDFNGDNKNLLESDTLGIKQEEIQNAEVNEDNKQDSGKTNESRPGITTYAQVDSFSLLEKKVDRNRADIAINRSNIDLAFTGINTLNKTIKAHDVWAGNLANQVNSNANWINTIRSDISNLYGGISQLQASNAQRIMDIQSLRDSNVQRIKDIEFITSRVNQLSESNTQRIKDIQALRDSNAQRIKDIDFITSRVDQLSESNVLRAKQVAQLQESNGQRIKDIQSLRDSNAQRIKDIDFITSRVDQLSESNVLRAIQVAQLQESNGQRIKDIQSLRDSNAQRIKDIEQLNGKTDNLIASNLQRIKDIEQLNGKTDNLTASNLQRIKDIEQLNGKTDNLTLSNLQRIKDIDNLQKQIDSFSFSDVGIIASLVSVKDSVDNFKDDFNDLFGSNGELGLNAHDGTFTSMLKHQFIALRNDIRDLFSSKGTFWTDLKALLDIYFDINNKDSGFYRIRYSIVAGFGDLEKILDLIGTDTLNLRKSLITTNDSLMILKDWLKLIYEKPAGSVTVTVPPFDFNRLEQILKSLSFGDVVNEAGTNFWDFMKELIKSLGEIFSTAIGALSDIVQKILDLLGNLVDTVLSLIIPKDWDFLDNGFGDIKGKFDIKFKSFLDLGDLVKDLFKPTKKDFLKAISFTWFGVNFDFTKSQPFLDLYVPKFRLAMAVIVWALTAVYIYRKFTGTGDVINDN